MFGKAVLFQGFRAGSKATKLRIQHKGEKNTYPIKKQSRWPDISVVRISTDIYLEILYWICILTLLAFALEATSDDNDADQFATNAV